MVPPFERISIALNRFPRRITYGVVAGLVPATSNFTAGRKNNRGGRDKPGHGAAETT